MIGDRSWLTDLGYGYQQHLADATRYDRESLPFERWAVMRTWHKFVNLARLCEAIPEYTIEEWATANVVPGANGHGYSSTVLARRITEAAVLTKAAMSYVYRCSHRSHSAVKEHIDKGRVYPGNERALGKGKRLVYDYLKQAAETEKVLCQPTGDSPVDTPPEGRVELSSPQSSLPSARHDDNQSRGRRPHSRAESD